MCQHDIILPWYIIGIFCAGTYNVHHNKRLTSEDEKVSE